MNPKIICFTLGASLLIGMPAVADTAVHHAGPPRNPMAIHPVARPATRVIPTHNTMATHPVKTEPTVVVPTHNTMATHPVVPVQSARHMVEGKVVSSNENTLVVSASGRTFTFAVNSSTKFMSAGKAMTDVALKADDRVRVHYHASKHGAEMTRTATIVELRRAHPMHPAHPAHPAAAPAKTPAAH